MLLAICPLSSIPVRAQASEKSEMVTQLLFGEVVEIIKLSHKISSMAAGWVQIRCTWDDYIGWVSENQLYKFSENTTLGDNTKAISLELLQGAMCDDYSIPITIGATLPDFDGIQCKIGERRFTFSGQVVYPQQINPSADLLLKIARKYLYAPYLWGGRSPFGVDCSGLVQVCYQAINAQLPRDAYQQAEHGRTVNFVQETQPGDLAFFDNPSGNIIHVGIIMSDSMIIHASGRVRIDYIDHYGIYNNETKRYSHRLRIVKRLLEDNLMAQYTPNLTATPMQAAEPSLKLF